VKGFVGEDWRRHWIDMPEFEQRDGSPYRTIEVRFASGRRRREFLELIGEKPDRVKPVWFPKRCYLRQSVRGAPPVVVEANKYPVYVVSKGRWRSRLTVKALERMGVPYRVVIEPQERDEYASVIDPDKLLVLPFSNLGQGSIPARNWIWEHALEQGATWHWILDDNIQGFYRLYNNIKTPVACPNVFHAAENFVDRYENVGMAGLNYFMFASRKTIVPPFYLNTRIYSCILIRNDLRHRWRGRYNEDTDLSLRVLKDGLCTVLFNAFLCLKQTTMTIKGGNTDELYRGDGRLRMAESLRDQHPDCVTVSRRWGRWQHQVDYNRFRRNRLKLKTRKGGTRC
jgi:hypothetical protein